MSGMKFSELEGKDVISQDGRELGQVADVVLDAASWHIGTLVVKLERELLESFHMKRPMFGTQTIQLPTTHVSGVGDKVILHKTLEELTRLAREEVRRERGSDEADADADKADADKPDADKADADKPGADKPGADKPGADEAAAKSAPKSAAKN